MAAESRECKHNTMNEKVKIQTAPFRFLDLPRELRDRVYEFALAPGIVYFSNETWSDSEGWTETPHKDRDGPDAPRSRHFSIHPRTDDVNPELGHVYPFTLDIFATSHEVRAEAEEVFYGKNLLKFDENIGSLLDNDNIQFALRFLRSRTPYARSCIKKISLRVCENLVGNATSLRFWENGREDEEFDELCVLLSNDCRLQSLRLEVSNGDRHTPLDVDKPIDMKSEKMTAIPDWVRSLLQIKGLHQLTVYWGYEDTVFLRRTLRSAKAMRSTMVENGHKMSGNEGLRLQLRTICLSDSLDSSNCIEFMMDIDRNGKSIIQHERKVKVTPYAWCLACGRFEVNRRFCGCGGERYGTQCSSCYSDPSDCLCVCGAAWEDHPYIKTKAGDKTVYLDSSSVVAEVNGVDIWHSSKWGGKPLQAYLPEDLDVKYLHEAKELGDNGFILTVVLDHDDDECGDNDSLKSVHWPSEDEEDEKLDEEDEADEGGGKR